MQLGEKQKHPNIDAELKELKVMTKLCEELGNYVNALRPSNKAPMVPPTIVGAIGIASMDRGAKSHGQLLHH
jgi:hypothetical protein